MNSIYERLGEENLRILIDQFYGNVLANELISPLFQTDIDEVKRKQTMFLRQFFGGPDLYSQEFGHPMMRKRHLPHKITADGAFEWLKCMHAAIQTLNISQEFQTEIFQRFPQVAAHMVNS